MGLLCRNVDGADPSAVAALGPRQPSAQAAAVTGRGNACSTRSVTPDTDTSGEAPQFLRVTGACTPATAEAELAADVAGDMAAASPSGRRQVAADSAWAAAADLAADVAGNPRDKMADVAPPFAITSPLRKSPQKYKSVTTLHSASVAEDAHRLISGNTFGSTGVSTSTAAVVQLPSTTAQVTGREWDPSRDQAIAAGRDESDIVDMPLLQRMQSLHGSPNRLKSRASYSSQVMGAAKASQQMPGQAGSTVAATAGTAASAEQGVATHAGGPTTTGEPGGPAMVSGGPAGSAGAPGGLAGVPAAAATQGDPTAELLTTGSGGPHPSGTQGVPSTVGDPINSQGQGGGWLVNGDGQSIPKASAEAMMEYQQQSEDALAEMLDDSEQTESEDEDDEDAGDALQTDDPMDQDYNRGTEPSNTREQQGRCGQSTVYVQASSCMVLIAEASILIHLPYLIQRRCVHLLARLGLVMTP